MENKRKEREVLDDKIVNEMQTKYQPIVMGDDKNEDNTDTGIQTMNGA